MWNRVQPAQIVTDAEGVGRIITDLHRNLGLATAARGVDVRVFAQTNGNFIVYLDRYQTTTLRKAIDRYEFSDVYGPRPGRSTDES